MEWNLADLFERVVDTIPDREALVCGDRRLTYRALDERANRLAHHLAAEGIGPGDHVGIQSQNCSEYLETALACFKIRAVSVNVNYRYVEEELRYLYDDADLKALVVQREFADRARAAAKLSTKQLLGPMLVIEDEYDAAIAAQRPDRDFAPRSGGDIYVIYTGGTTGMPKGVMWRHEDLFFAGMGGGNPQGEPLHTPEQIAESVRAKTPGCTFPVAPLMHGAAQLASHIGFNWGDKIVLLGKFAADEVWRLVQDERVNTISIVGDAMARPMAEALDDPAAPARDLSSLFVISSAGAILSEAVRDKLTAHLPNCFILDSFGSSETGFQGMAAGDSSPDKGLKFTMNERCAVVSEGRYVIEPGSEEVGFVGQRGHIPLGYYGDPEKTAATFWEIDGERWVVPGDMATIDADGVIHVLGRGSVCINTGGEKVFPEEVEAALKSHPAVYDAVVVGVPDERWGQRVTALVTLRPEVAADESGVIEHARTKVAGYKVPRQVFLVDEIVRSPSGKLDYPWAKARAAELAGA